LLNETLSVFPFVYYQKTKRRAKLIAFTCTLNNRFVGVLCGGALQVVVFIVVYQTHDVSGKLRLTVNAYKI